MKKESREEQDWVIDERVASIRAVIKCIVDHNLESQFSYKGLEQDIEHLLIQKESDQRIRACLIKARAPAYNANKVSFSTSAPVHPKASASKLYPTTHTMACIFANMDGKNLQLFLNEHLEEHEWMHEDIYDALQMSSDSGQLVLDAIQGFYPPHSKKGAIDIEAGVIRKSCIFLLEILVRLSPQIKPQVKRAALKLAVYWKTKAAVETANSVVVLGFLLLVGAYGLAPTFTADELRNLFQTVAENRLAPQLSLALGFSEKVPDFIRRLIKRKLYLEAIRYIYGFSLVDEFPPRPLLQRYLIHEKEWAKHVCKDKAIRKELTALRAVIRCIELHGLESQYSPEALKTRVEELLTQQRSVAPAPATKGQPPKEVDKSSARQSVAVLAQPQELFTQQRSVEPAPAAKGQPPKEVDKSSARQSVALLAQPQELLTQQRSVAPAPVTKGQPSKEVDKSSARQSVSVLAQPQEQDRRKRFDSSTPPQQQAAKKIRLDHVSTAHPIQSLQHHHPPGVSTAETAPYLTTPYTHYSLGASTHLPALHMSHIQVGYGSGIPAIGGFPPFGSVGTAFGSAPNFNAKPYTVAETPYYSLSVPHLAGLSNFKR